MLYTFIDTNQGAYRDIVFLDKYNLEWDLKVANEVMDLTFQGMPIVRLGNDIPSTSNFVYCNPGPIYTPVMNTPSFTSFRPIPSTQRVSFVEPANGIGNYVQIEWSSGNWSANQTTTHIIITYTFDKHGL